MTGGDRRPISSGVAGISTGHRWRNSGGRQDAGDSVDENICEWC